MSGNASPLSANSVGDPHEVGVRAATPFRPERCQEGARRYAVQNVEASAGWPPVLGNCADEKRRK